MGESCNKKMRVAEVLPADRRLPLSIGSLTGLDSATERCRTA